MIDFSAPHIGFVIACYAITLVVLAGLVLWILARSRAITNRLEQLQRSGTGRRGKPDGANP
jgi:heme exporter protein D